MRNLGRPFFCAYRLRGFQRWWVSGPTHETVYVVSDTWTVVLLGLRGEDCQCFRSCARWTCNDNTVCYPSNLNPNPNPYTLLYTYAIYLKEPDNQPRGAIILVQNIGTESNKQHISNEIVLEHTRISVTSQAQQTRCDGIERV